MPENPFWDYPVDQDEKKKIDRLNSLKWKDRQTKKADRQTMKSPQTEKNDRRTHDGEMLVNDGEMSV